MLIASIDTSKTIKSSIVKEYRKMKTAFKILSAVFVVSICLSSCIKVSNRFSPLRDKSEAVCVEIYKVEKTYTEANADDLRAENTPVCVLKNERCTAAVEQLCELEYTKETLLVPIAADGGVYLIVYKDGAYDLLAEEGKFSYYEKDGGGRYDYDYSDYSGERAFSELIEELIDSTAQQ